MFITFMNREKKIRKRRNTKKKQIEHTTNDKKIKKNCVFNP